eukprot:6549930-Pyramimonas_sp.AAC.1
MVRLKDLLRDNMASWRSADDIIMLAGRNGGILPTHIVLFIGILPNDKCWCNRVGHVWINPMYLWDSDPKCQRSDLSIDDMH